MSAETMPAIGQRVRLADGTTGDVWALAGCRHDDAPRATRLPELSDESEQLIRHADVDRLACRHAGEDKCTPAVWVVDGSTWHRALVADLQ